MKNHAARWLLVFFSLVHIREGSRPAYTKNPSYNQTKSYEETFESKHNWFYEEVYFV